MRATSKIEINSSEIPGYIARGFFPLSDINFIIPITQRIEFQNELFCVKNGFEYANEKFYRYCWETMQHVCEECMRPLYDYSAGHISHIISRGANRSMALDCRNVNILCAKHHTQWEVGKREVMRIYQKNLKRIELLNSEYK